MAAFTKSNLNCNSSLVAVYKSMIGISSWHWGPVRHSYTLQPLSLPQGFCAALGSNDPALLLELRTAQQPTCWCISISWPSQAARGILCTHRPSSVCQQEDLRLPTATSVHSMLNPKRAPDQLLLKHRCCWFCSAPCSLADNSAGLFSVGSLESLGLFPALKPPHSTSDKDHPCASLSLSVRLLRGFTWLLQSF